MKDAGVVANLGISRHFHGSERCMGYRYLREQQKKEKDGAEKFEDDKKRGRFGVHFCPPVRKTAAGSI